MYIFKNAIKNLGRNKGRNFLLGVILLAIVATTVVTLSITRTTEAIIADYQMRFGSEVFIEPDMDAVLESLMSQTESSQNMRGITLPTLDSQLVLEIIQSPYLANYTVSAVISSGNSTEIQALYHDHPEFLALVEQTPSIELDDYGRLLQLGSNGEFELSNQMGMFSILGDRWEEFETGERQLIEGNIPTTYGEVLISETLAQLNNLKVGDRFTLTHQTEDADDLILRNFIISGLYADLTTTEANLFMPVGIPFLNRSNEILTTFQTAVFPEENGSSMAMISGTYYLANPSDLEAFEAYVRNLGLSEDFIVYTDEATYNAIVAPVLGLSQVAQTFMWVVLILGGIILALLSSIAIRERKYEIGVLRAMGMKKLKVAFGLWLEMLTITIFCLILGFGTGTVLAQPISDSLLEVQLESLITPEPDNPFMGLGGHGGGGRGIMLFGNNEADANPIEALDVQIDTSTILEIIIISLALTTVASVVSISKVTKYEPIKILMERN